MQQRLHDLQKHDHIDAIDVEPTEQKQQRQIGSEDADRASHPLIVPRLIEQERKGEETGAHIQCPLHVVLHIGEVLATILHELHHFQDEVAEAVEDDEPDAGELGEGDTLVERDEVGARTVIENGGPDECIVMVAGGKGDDEIGEQSEKEKVEGEVEGVDGETVGEPFLSEESFAERMAEMVGATELHHHLDGEMDRVLLSEQIREHIRSVEVWDNGTLSHRFPSDRCS